MMDDRGWWREVRVRSVVRKPTNGKSNNGHSGHRDSVRANFMISGVRLDYSVLVGFTTHHSTIQHFSRNPLVPTVKWLEGPDIASGTTLSHRGFLFPGTYLPTEARVRPGHWWRTLLASQWLHATAFFIVSHVHIGSSVQESWVKLN